MEPHLITQVSNCNISTPLEDSAVAKVLTSTKALTAITKEVAELLQHVPYVKALSGIILQFINIREEMQQNKERCLEIIDKVLNMSQWIYEKLLVIARLGDGARSHLAQIETSLISCHSTLDAILRQLKKHQSRSWMTRLITRGIEDLVKIDRSVDSLEKRLVRDIIFDIKIQQGVHASTSRTDSTLNVIDYVLPPKPHIFIERDTQLAAAVNVLLQIESSRIAILGGGGFGKTTLARTILHDVKIIKRYQFRYFLSCEGMSDVDTLLLGLGAMLGVHAARSGIMASVRRILGVSTTLLCLDNFETPWEKFETRTKVEELLESIADIPNLSLIITLRGEQRPSKVSWSKPFLPPLSTLSLEGAKLIIENIAGHDTVDDFTLQLLQAIDGIPLAITLVSTLLRDGESSKSLWRRWTTDHTQIVYVGDDRQSNLDRSIALSVNSIRMSQNKDTRYLLAALSLLPYGFPDGDALEDFQEHLDITNIHTVIQTLRITALIKLEEMEGSLRIQMLSPIRLFCQHFLAAEITHALPKTAKYYIHLLSAAGNEWTNADCYSRIMPEVKNIHFVFQKAFMSSSTQDEEMLGLIQTTSNHLTGWSTYSGYYVNDTMQMALSKAINFPALYGNCLLSLGILSQWEAKHEIAVQYLTEAVKVFQQGNSKSEAEALQCLGNSYYAVRKFSEAEAVLKACLNIFVEEDNTQRGACIRFNLGRLYLDRGEYSNAQDSLTQALEALRECSDLINQANTAAALSRLHMTIGNLVEAEEYANESLTAAKDANYAVGEGNALERLGRICLRTDRLIEARNSLERAMTIYENQNDIINQLYTAESLGQVYIQSDRLADAETLLTKYSKVPLDVVQVSYVLTALGWVYVCGRDFHKAEHILDRALRLFQKSQDKSWQAIVLAHLGVAYLNSGQLDKAERVAKSIPDIGCWREAEMRRLWVLGDLCVIKGQFEDAEESLGAAMEHAKLDQRSYQQGNILRSIGTLHMNRGNIEMAVDKFQEALEIHRRVQWISEQATDLRKLGEAFNALGKQEQAGKALEEAENLTDSVREIRALSQ